MIPDNFQYENGQLYADGVQINKLASAVGTPCYVYSRQRMIQNFERLHRAFPQAEIHYSLKANANLAIVQTLIQAGAGLDAVSGGEIFRAIRAGANPAQIVFAGVGKTAAELTYALETGIGWFNVESALELVRIEEIARTLGKRPRVALRINPDVQADTHHYIATGHSAAKFGIHLDEAPSLLDRYAGADHLAIEGIHVHIGSQLGSVDRTVEAAQTVLPLFEAYPALHALDLGGGFPVAYGEESVPPVEAFADALQSVLAGRQIDLLLEPGRYIIADAGILVVEVQYHKNSPEGMIAVTDGGMTELLRPALYSAIHEVLPARQADSHVITHVVGPVCESADVLRTNVILPLLEPGDRLAIMHTGAYGAVMGSTYNARPRPPEIMVEGATWKVIRRRETWEDLIALESLTG